MSGPSMASAGAKMWLARPNAKAKMPTAAGVDSHVRKKTSLRDSANVPMMLARPVGSANRQKPGGSRAEGRGEEPRTGRRGPRR